MMGCTYNGEEQASKYFLRTTFKAPKHLRKLSQDTHIPLLFKDTY